MSNYLYLNLILFLSFGILSFILTLPYLKKLKFGQSIRSDGPQKHLIKKGTPTMGGIIILFCCLIFFSLLMIEFNKSLDINGLKIFLLIIPILGYGILGFIDDFLIIIKNNNSGLKASTKLIIQIIIATIVYFIYLSVFKNNDLNFFGIMVDIKFLYGIFIVFLLVGVTNATNLTDGIDGLLAGCSIISYLSFGIIAIYKEEYIIIFFSFSMCIALLAFLFFNLPNASVFMGNVGSLLIGAGLVIESILLKMELLLIFMGFIYLVETLSVIIQVWFFKKTKGQRLFRMSPFHHHLELSGLKEIEIDLILYLIQFAMCIAGIILGIRVF